MIKDIRLSEDQSITVNSAMGWLFVYREQFGHDIMPDLWPLFDIGIDIAKSGLEDGNISFDDDTIENLKVTMSAFEVVTVVNILWAMARNADKGVPAPSEWVNQFETFPLDIILPEMVKLIIESMATRKNSQSLLESLKALK